MTIRPPSPITSRLLKLVAILLIVSALLDFVILPIPYQIAERTWRLTVVSQIIERGIIPMIGVALMYAGFWVENPDGVPSKGAIDLRLWSNLLAFSLGVMYFVMVPIYLLDIDRARDARLQQVLDRAREAETRLSSPEFSAQIEQRRELLRNQIGSLLQDDTQFDQAISNLEGSDNPDSAERIERLQEFKNDPTALDAFLNEQADQFRDQSLSQVQDRKKTLEEQIGTSAIKNSIRIGLSGLLLSLGYLLIGVVGVQQMKRVRLR